MENRKEALRGLKICRFCLTREEPLTSIYDRSFRTKYAVPLPLQIMACVAIEKHFEKSQFETGRADGWRKLKPNAVPTIFDVPNPPPLLSPPPRGSLYKVFPSDGMPGTICNVCRYFMDQSYRFKQICRQGDESLMQYMQRGEYLQAVKWPTALVKSMQLATGDQNVNVAITKDEGASEEGEDDVEYEEDVVNIKIESDNASAANNSQIKERKGGKKTDKSLPRIKVTQMGDELLITAEADETPAGEEDEDLEEEEEQEPEETDPLETDMMEVDGVAKDVETEDSTGVFPCDQCDRSYPLRQLLELHRKQQHRRRQVKCKECGVAFFSKYDLMTHMLMHTGQRPFECAICKKKFNRLNLLRRHEKLAHADDLKLLCSDCDATFLSVEELTAHHAKHREYQQRPYECKKCVKRFQFKQSLSRHMEMIHGGKAQYQCDYCPEAFTTSMKLMRHVQSHAGVRPYPCKYCYKSFIKSHHYTRHLRMQHGHPARSRGGPMQPQETFKCDQCEENFTKQDDLIYHSAIHATQNLTCPLCKDKFDNVDSVTEHIKLHEGEQYMCDLCELLFTSDERLEAHVREHHEEELRRDLHSEEQPGDEDEGDCGEDTVKSEGTIDMEASFDIEGVDGEYYVVKNEDSSNPSLLTLKPSEEGIHEYTVHELNLDVTATSGKTSKDDSKDSETEATYTELETVDTIKMAQLKQQAVSSAGAASSSSTDADKQAKVADATANILRKAEEVKKQRKLAEKQVSPQFKPPTPQRQPLQPQLKRQNTPPRIPPPPLTPKPSSPTKEINKKSAAAVVKQIVQARASKSEAVLGKKVLDNPTKTAVKRPGSSDDIRSPSKKAHAGEGAAESGREREGVVKMKTNDKSLKLLEKDLQELKRNMRMPLGLHKSGMASVQHRIPSKHGEMRRDDRSKGPHGRERDREERAGQQHVRKLPQSSTPMKKIVRTQEVKNGSSPRLSPISSSKKLQPEKSKDRDRQFSSKDGDRPSSSKELNKSIRDSGSDKPKKAQSISAEDGAPRRSSRPSKIKDYAKMIRDRTGLSSDDEEYSDEDTNGNMSAEKQHGKHEEDTEEETPVAIKAEPKLVEAKITEITPGPAKRGRGRPRKNATTIVTPTSTTPNSARMISTGGVGRPSAGRPSVSRPSMGKPRGRPSKSVLMRKQQVLQRRVKEERKQKEEEDEEEEDEEETEEDEDEEMDDTDYKGAHTKTVGRPREVVEQKKAESEKKVPAKSYTNTHSNQSDARKLIVQQDGTVVSPAGISVTNINKVLTAVTPTGQKVLMSPSGQTLTKVPASLIKNLPPGVKPLPLPPNMQLAANAANPGQLCEMKIGQKTVKVQKIVMTKAEVEAMAKKGLVEMKDGTMVLKQGIKLPSTGNISAIKSSLLMGPSKGEVAAPGGTNQAAPATLSPVGIASSSMPVLEQKKEQPAPTRCEDIGEDDAT